MFYKQTSMEKWITNQYIRNNITDANDINMEKLSSIFDIVLWKMEMEPRYDILNKNNFICIDSRESLCIQKEQFFHELCHILFHVVINLT